MYKIKKNSSGLTLIELIVSMAIILIIVTAFIPLFSTSAKNNSKSKTTLDSTYLGKDSMELVYELSRNVPYEKLEEELIKKGYKSEISKKKYGYEYSDKKYSNMTFTEEGNLVRVVIRIYKDKSMNRLEAQYESLYSWFGRGILSER